MYARLLLSIVCIALCAQLAGCGRKEMSFAADIQPILKERCVECHNVTGEGATASNFSVVDYDSLMKGTSFGAVIVPGSSISSTLYMVVAGKTAPEIRMPPHHSESLAEGRGEALSADELTKLAAWIDQGAKNN